MNSRKPLLSLLLPLGDNRDVLSSHKAIDQNAIRLLRLGGNRVDALSRGRRNTEAVNDSALAVRQRFSSHDRDTTTKTLQRLLTDSSCKVYSIGMNDNLDPYTDCGPDCVRHDVIGGDPGGDEHQECPE